MSEVLQLGRMPTFPSFYEALYARSPFPWQKRLAEKVAEEERWPTEIGVPTGLGKTTCLDIAVWWLASQADQSPAVRTAPTRIWWLVNRRLLVDSTATHARCLSEALRDSDATPLRIAGDRLRSLAATPGVSPIDVVRLRGGVAARLPTDPSKPTILLSTIPMYGSRLLFRGYGTSRTMRPIDAALAGSDSLLLVDEAHLARHLTDLVSALAQCTDGAAQILGEARSRPHVAALTATGDAKAGDRFDLDVEDENNETVRQRLDARKPTEVQVHNGDSIKHLVQAVQDLLEDARPSSCLVFVNTPDTAREVFTRIRKRFPVSAADMLLLTGRTREREAQRTRKRILDRVDGMSASQAPARSRARHLIVVATQTLEVGADIDSEYMVTEECGVRALTQRLGRLNRFGHHDHARGVYVHAPPKTRRPSKSGTSSGWPVYGAEPETVLRRLQDAWDPALSGVDLSPRRVSKALGEPGDDPGRAPEVLDGLVWEWTKTTNPPAGEAPVEPYFSGIAGIDHTVSVVWRAHVPEAEHRVWPRPFDREVVGVPLREVRKALGDDASVTRLRPDHVTVESIQARHLRPGNVVLLPVDRGLLDDFGWSPEATDPVVDVSIAARGLPLDEEAIRRIGGVSLEEPVDTVLGVLPLRKLLQKALGDVPDDEVVDEEERQEAAECFHRALFDTHPREWEQAEWHDFLRALDPRVVAVPGEVPRFLLRACPVRERPSDEFDETSLAPTAAMLDSHGEAVAILAQAIAEKIGLSSEFANVIHQAGRWHDVGKADIRFQRWLDPQAENNGRPRPLLAKSRTPRHLWNAARVVAGWPRGGRHEALSARLLRLWIDTSEEDRDPSLTDLLIHLVISHHGSGRPVVPPVIDSTLEMVASEPQAIRIEAPADLSLVDWDQPARFRRLNQKFGPWGLALLETVLRRADHLVSGGLPVPARETET